MIVYVDTSVVLRHLVAQPGALGWEDWESAYSSELLGLEARRVIDRLRLESALDEVFAEKLDPAFNRDAVVCPVASSSFTTSTGKPGECLWR